MSNNPKCRFCGEALHHTLVDLGSTPLANSFLSAADSAEERYPLHARVCGSCFLAQVDDVVPAEYIFSEYAYFSSYSDTWIAHGRRYAGSVIPRLGLSKESLVIEVASNDGYLLQHFMAESVPVLGVEPAANVAATAIARGIPTEIAFFGEPTARSLAARGRFADLMIANNVLAHVPNILDFAKGFAILLKANGVATFEFPHILNLIKEGQFDTIYHEHYSYLSFVAVEKIFSAAGLRIFDIEELATHGGSLRVYACRASACYAETEHVANLRHKEVAAKLDRIEGYDSFGPRVAGIKKEFLEFLGEAKRNEKRVAAYGAAAKGNTFLNYCNVGVEDVVCVFDRSKQKQGKFLPGSRLPILAPERLGAIAPDYLVILPWNLADEIIGCTQEMGGWGGRYVTALPQLVIRDR